MKNQRRKLRFMMNGLTQVPIGVEIEYAIGLCINRFDEETKKSFLDLYRKVDPTLPKAPEQSAPETDPSNLKGDEIPF